MCNFNLSFLTFRQVLCHPVCWNAQFAVCHDPRFSAYSVLRLFHSFLEFFAVEFVEFVQTGCKYIMNKLAKGFASLPICPKLCYTKFRTSFVRKGIRGCGVISKSSLKLRSERHSAKLRHPTAFGAVL